MTRFATILHARTRRLAVQRRRHVHLAGVLERPQFLRNWKPEPHQEDRRNVRPWLSIALFIATCVIVANVWGML